MYVWRTTYIIAQQEIIVPAVVGGIFSVLLGASPSLCREEAKEVKEWQCQPLAGAKNNTLSLYVCVCEKCI